MTDCDIGYVYERIDDDYHLDIFEMTKYTWTNQRIG
jgi:hypothetical protein